MSPEERKNLQKLDDLVLNALPQDLEKIQQVDSQTQLEGVSLYDVYIDSNSLIDQKINHSRR